MRRVSFFGVVANVAAIALLGLTGVALAGPTLVTGFIGGLSESGISLSNAFINTLSLFSLGGDSSVGNLFYGLYATVTTFVSGSAVGSSLQLIGYIVSGALSGLSFTSSAVVSVLEFGSNPVFSTAALFFSPLSSIGVPEPNSIAILVSGVAGLAALAGRRRARRLAKRPPTE